MRPKSLFDAAGYSLVEVMASIVILSIAIIPMVAMFDSGLKAASTSGNYDTARSFANKKLEQAKSLSYAQVRDNYPGVPPAINATDGSTTGAITNSSAPDEVPNGFSYTVSKRHLTMTAGASPDRTNLATAAAALGDTGLIEVKVTVSWGGKTYATTGIVAKDTP